MISYWTEKKANGSPIEPGTFARVIDLEDGTHPQYVYGRTMDEVLQKIERNHANAQQALQTARRAPEAVPAAAAAAPIAARTRLTADERMRLTLDLQNPARSAAAIVALTADETGIDPAAEARARYGMMAEQWEREHPEFYQHPGNRRILGREAINRAGGNPALVTRELLTQCFNELLNDGQLFEGQNEERNRQPETPSSFPAETQVQRTERPTQPRSITGYVPRGRSGAAPTRTLKYSEEEYWGMPAAKRRELLMTRDPDFEAAAMKYDPPEQQRAS